MGSFKTSSYLNIGAGGLTYLAARRAKGFMGLASRVSGIAWASSGAANAHAPKKLNIGRHANQAAAGSAVVSTLKTKGVIGIASKVGAGLWLGSTATLTKKTEANLNIGASSLTLASAVKAAGSAAKGTRNAKAFAILSAAAWLGSALLDRNDAKKPIPSRKTKPKKAKSAGKKQLVNYRIKTGPKRGQIVKKSPAMVKALKTRTK